MRGIASLLLLALALGARAAAGQDTSGVIEGLVLETVGGTPLASVAVRLQDTGRTVLTDEAGRFELPGVPAGPHELYVSVVDFILVKQSVVVAAGGRTTVTIVMAEGTGTLAQSVTVVGSPEVRTPALAPSAQTLRGKDLQQLRGLITNDPFRAIQVLPGVATGDDLKSEFTVRGSAIDHMVFTFEGVAAPLLVHTVQRVVDAGSLAMVNGDVLDEVALVGGSYPQRYGNRLGAALDFRMREGSRERLQARLSVSGTDSALVTEGPIGRSQRGSWLTSIRRSYLDLVTANIDTPIDFTFGFSDTQAKIVYDAGPSNQLQIAVAAGRSRLKLDPSDIDLGDPEDGRNASALGVVSWRRIFSPAFTLTQRLALALSDYTNTNINGAQLARGSGRDFTYRAEWTYAPRQSVDVEGGGELRATAQAGHAVDINATRTDLRQHFDEDAAASSVFGQVNLRAGRVNVTPGARVDHWTLTHDTSVSPWVQGSYGAGARVSLQGGAGIYRQRPTFDQLVGLRGDRSLSTERAYHADLGLAGRLSGAWQWRATVYDREERDVIRLPGTEYRVVNNTLVVPSLTTKFRNSLTGYARGLEFVLERRSANGLSGWASYALASSHYRDTVSHEAFFGDYDQRHTVNVYGSYRFSGRFSASGRFRQGSNFPTPGYWEDGAGVYSVGSSRNQLRVPAYARLDLRVNRTFTKRATRITLFAEVLNVLDRKNVRYSVPSVNRRTRVADGLYGDLFPRVPSAGVLIEF